MAKFIEVNHVVATRQTKNGKTYFGTIEEPILINADHIRIIRPQRDRCIIEFAEEGSAITVAHSSNWIIGLINGNGGEK